MKTKELLLGSFQAALAAADPLHIVPPHLPKAPAGRTLVVGAGKAAAAMAAAAISSLEAKTAVGLSRSSGLYPHSSDGP